MKEVLKYLRALENENSNLKQKLKITLYEKIELLTKLRTASVMRLRLATEKEIENLKYMYADKITDLEMENFKLKEQLRKQKRKRCIAMARACHLMLGVRLFPNKEYVLKWAERGNKWIDLADKLKEKK